MINRFIISGDNVQGVQLRESFVKAANNLQLKGQIRNLPNGEVEIIFLFKENEEDIRKCITQALVKLAEKGLLDGEETKSIRINGEKIDSFHSSNLTDEKTEEYLEVNNFILVREHELKETAWALQGAGRVFFVAAEKVDSLLGYKEKEVRGRLESVKRELLHIQSHMENVDEPICLKQFIADPLIDITAGKSEEKDLIRGLIEFYHDYVSYKKRKTSTQEAEKEFIERIKKLIEGINEQTKSFNTSKT
jgi:acylphosphatase